MYLLIADPVLSTALRRWAATTLGTRAMELIESPSQVTDPDYVLTSEADCSTFECAELAEQGCKVVVLAAFPRTSSQVQYVGAGAVAYLPMSLDVVPLALALKRQPVARGAGPEGV